MAVDSKIRKTLLIVLFVLFAAIVFGLVWFFFLANAPDGASSGFGWYLFSFAAGLTMIVLPCTLPLAFVIVPLSMGKGPLKGFLIALAFGLGVAITLSMYGVAAAVVGKVAIGSLGAPLETIKNWLYFIAGLFAYIFSLGELGLVKFRMPTYSGALPGFIQKQPEIAKALLLGLFLGNIGVGCPHPATPVILTQIAVSGNIFYGWLLFFVHAIGRILPLIFLAILGILGVNALAGLVKNKEKIERVTGWGMVFVAAFILVLGFFTHDWWVISGQHTFLESLTQEHAFLTVIGQRSGAAAPHAHAMPPADSRGLFGTPISWGTWVLLALWIIPFFWSYKKKKAAAETIQDQGQRDCENKLLSKILWNSISFSLLLILVFGYVLPHRFLEQSAAEEAGHMEMAGTMPGMTVGHAGHGPTMYHEESDVKEGVAVNFNFSPPKLAAGQPIKFDFFVNKKPGNVPVPESDLEVQHEKKMHVIGVRRDLNEFFHLHPESETQLKISGVMTVNHTFKNPGEYKIWSEILYQGVDHVFGHPPINVTGTGQTLEPDKTTTKSKVVSDYQVSIIYDQLHVGDNHIDFSIKTADGNDATLDNYLGEKTHLTVIKDDWSQFIHTHPNGHTDMMNMGSDHHGSLRGLINTASAHGDEEATPSINQPPMPAMPGHENDIHFTIPFAQPGLYKAFAQFKPSGAKLAASDDYLLAEFWLQVAEKSEEVTAAKAGTFSTPWWRNLLVSLALIVLLSWGVKKYIGGGAANN